MGWVSGEHASFLALGFPKEEDPSLDRAKSQKRNKVAIVRMRRNKVREADENDDDEEDEAERSPGVRWKRHSYSKTCQQRQKEHLSILEGSLSTPTSKTKSSRWSMTDFRQYLCMCCHDKQKSMEENKASDSKESRDPNENEDGVTGSINKRERQQAPGGTPREGLGKSQENGECNPSACK